MKYVNMFRLMGFIENMFGDQNSKLLKKYKDRVVEINQYSEEFKSLSDIDLSEKTIEFKNRLKKGENLNQILPEAFAVVRETSARTLNERHYDVQLIGGIAIHDGNIAEMRTGEGKTLVATLPTYLNALVEKGVHVVTVNDYLARRDAVWMGQIYSFLGLNVSVINQNGSFMYDPSHTEKDEERDEQGSYRIVYEFLRPISRQEAYQADIVYGTNSEFGFDYLRDNIEYQIENLRQREPYFAIIDEIDSILIDEARTPLIISAPAQQAENLYQVFASIVKNLEKETDFTVDEKHKAIQLTDDGITKAEKVLGIENIYTEKGVKYVHHLETAVRAKALFQKDKEYVVKDGQIIIVDEFTGRLQPSRRWSGGLHQAIEAKENLNVQEESRTYASITYQNYFRMYEKLAGMTGTAITSSEEFYKVYGLDVITIPTNRDIQRKDLNDLIFQTEKGKFKAIANRVKQLNEKGQPVLIGTSSIEKNELLSNFLVQENIPHKVLNAKNHENEAEIIAQAGQKGAVTIATNMAGRGVDIKLGGVPFKKENAEQVKELGGLYVIGTERHDARRIDNQLRGRSGRQGDPGETQFYVSFEDTLMRIFASDIIKNLMSKSGLAEDQPIENKFITRTLENAQTKIEGFNFDARKHVLQYDDVLNTQRKSIYNRRRKILMGDSEALDLEMQEVIKLGDEKLNQIIENKKQALGDEWYKVIRRMFIQAIDTFWVDHLEMMEYIRSSVNLRAYGQRDPLVEYKKESLTLYRNMLAGIYEQVSSLIPNLDEGAFLKAEQKLKETMQKAKIITAGTSVDLNNKNTFESEESQYGRNDKVVIEKEGQTQELKYKKAEEFLKQGWKIKK
jgi:preprotein translocase subunit SecA